MLRPEGEGLHPVLLLPRLCNHETEMPPAL